LGAEAESAVVVSTWADNGEASADRKTSMRVARVIRYRWVAREDASVEEGETARC
jgi:hypothetical protein